MWNFSGYSTWVSCKNMLRWDFISVFIGYFVVFLLESIEVWFYCRSVHDRYTMSNGRFEEGNVCVFQGEWSIIAWLKRAHAGVWEARPCLGHRCWVSKEHILLSFVAANCQDKCGVLFSWKATSLYMKLRLGLQCLFLSICILLVCVLVWRREKVWVQQWQSQLYLLAWASEALFVLGGNERTECKLRQR